MKRTLPLCLVAGCLWIGPEVHEDRVESVAVRASVASVIPEAWSACSSSELAFAVTLQLSEVHARAPFDVWAAVAGGPRIGVGQQTASAAATIEVVLDDAVGLDEVPCTGSCRVPVTIGLERPGVSDEVEVELVLVTDTAPTLGAALAIDTLGVATDLGAAPTQGSPPSSLSTADWPAIGFTLVDPHLAMDLGGQPNVAVCPPGTPPEMATLTTGPCTHVSATREATFDTTGAAAFVVSSQELGAFGCDAALAGDTVELHAVVLDHGCGGSYGFAMTSGSPVVVDPDCDEDLATWPADCDDLDAARSPSATETWYDGVDSDCSGGSDDDQDGDGADAVDRGGTDCDDLDALRYPGALEICDGKDNDCDEVLAVDQVTWSTPAGPVNLPTLQEALDLANDGDTVTVCDGRYDGSFTVRTDVVLTCGSQLTGACTLAAAGPGSSVLTIGLPGDQLDVDVSHVTITGAAGVAEGGGIDGRNAAVLDLQRVVVVNNAATVGGGLSAAGAVTLLDTEIRDNTATDGGGIVLADGAVLTLEGDSVVSLNVADRGGALCTGASVTVEGGTFADNFASFGGALFVEGDGTSVLLTDLTLTTNAAVDEGGGLSVASTGTPVVLTILGGTFSGNKANFGGALAASGTDVWVTDTVWSGNDGDEWGGAIYIIGGSLDTLAATFEGNLAELGGAVYTDGSALDLENGTLLTNSAEFDGGALYVRGGATVFLRGVLEVDGNLAAGDAQGIHVEDQQVVACVGTQVNDPVENKLVTYLGDPDCFELTAEDFDSTQCTGC